MKNALIIGGGFGGCSAAHQLELKGGWDVTLVEAAPFLGGGCKTLFWGGHPYTFGPRHFLTQKEHVYDYLNEICPLRSCGDHIFLTYVEKHNHFYNYPIHMDDVKKMPDSKEVITEIENAKKINGAKNAKDFENFWISSVGKILYNRFVDNYSKKMWRVNSNKSIDIFGWSPKGVTIKEGAREAWDVAISAYPFAKDGYDQYFKFATKNCKVLLSTRITNYDIPNKTVVIDNQKIKYDLIVNTIPPDILFDFCYGELPFVGRDFHKIVLPVEYATPDNVYFLYYANQEEFTRIVEYKRFTKHKSNTTLLGLEIPSKNGRYYPLPTTVARSLAKKYFDEMPDNVFSVGRAGSYMYEIDIDDAIEQSMEFVKKI